MPGGLNPTLKHLLSLLGMDRRWVRGEGVWLFDHQGRRFLDCYAQYGAVALGHNAPIVREAVREALDACEPAMVQPYRAPHAEALAEALSEAAPGDAACCVFTTSGAEAVEAAIKLVRARTGRDVILSNERSFHGKTLGALAATGQTHHAERFGPRPGGFERVPFGDTGALEEYMERDGERVAAFFVEPIQGEGGVHAAPPGYLRRARELCTRFGAALVCDEIQTGLGRTGRLFACEHEGVAPDVLLVAKALGGGLFPLGACLATSEFWDAHFGLRHSSTFANNNVACRVGLAVLHALTKGGLIEQAARRGERLKQGLEQLARRHPDVIAAVRGRGLMCAVELRPYVPETGAFLSFVRHQGLQAYTAAATLAHEASLLVLPALGDGNVLRVAPPLVIEDGEIDLALSGFDAVCGRLARSPALTILNAIGALEHQPEPETAPSNGRASRATAGRTTREAAPPRLTSWRPSRPPAYAFLVHYTSPRDVLAMDPSLATLSADELRRYTAFVSQFPPGVVMPAPTIHSTTGASVEGLILALPLLPEEMQRRGLRRVGRDIQEAVDLAYSLGVGLVGLGGYTVPYSRRGTAVTGRGPAITTGNALTAAMACAAAEERLAARGLTLREARVAVVGARGSVGALCARLLARARPASMRLVGNPQSGAQRLERLRDELAWRPAAVQLQTDLQGLVECDLVLTATGAGRPILDAEDVAPGTVVCDVARPPDTSERLRARGDVTVIDGGLVRLPDAGLRFGPGNLQGLPDGVQLACLAETVLLALEGETCDRGVGDDVPVEEAERMLALCARHGFRLAPASLDGRPVATPVPATPAAERRAEAAL